MAKKYTVPKKCEYCAFGKSSAIDGEILCKKHGITHNYDCCRSYKYDPLKRTPETAKPSQNYSPEDFLL